METTSTQRPNFTPAERSVPTIWKPRLACTPMEAALRTGKREIVAILQTRELEVAINAVSIGAHVAVSDDPLSGCLLSMSLHPSESQRVVPDSAPSTFCASADPLVGSAFHPSDPRRVMG